MKPNKLKTIFIGTSDFGLPALRRLATSEFFALAAVITQPDKPAGRRMDIAPPPVKTEALKHNLPVLQPRNINTAIDEIMTIDPDIIIVAAYRQILPESVLAIPKYGCINLHASLLPKYRGAACVQAAILNGDDRTGVTVMKMDKGLDTGPILAQKTVNIDAEDTAGTLHDKLARLAGEILDYALKSYVSGKLTPEPQDEGAASCAKELTKRDGHIDWSQPAEKIERFIRAMNPWPGAFSFIGPDEKMLKITRAGDILETGGKQSGKLFTTDKKLAVQCGRGSLVIEELQLPGKKSMAAREFLNGYAKYTHAELK